MTNRLLVRLSVAPILLAASSFGAAQTIAPATPDNIEACRACHGPAGVSINPAIPNLAGQKSGYLEAQLMAFRGKERKNDFMNVIAGQLSDAQIHGFAAYWSSLPAVPSAATGSQTPVSAAIHSRMQLPANFPAGFALYQSQLEDGVMTKRYANAVAARAARKGTKLPDGSVIISVNYTAQKDGAGKDVAGDVQSYAGMESRKDWGKDIPLLLRNENWDYALFAADGKRRDELNQAQCLACHKPKESDSYVFTLKQLQARPAS